MRTHASVKRWLVVSLPGVATYLTLVVATALPFDYRTFADRDIDFLWQSLGINFLKTDPWGSLAVLHTQPPLLNALYAVDLALTPTSHAFLLAINILAVVATIAMLTTGILSATTSVTASAVGGVGYALLPGTVLYSLNVYNTTITASFAMLSVWPLSWALKRPMPAIALSACGALGLVLTRSSFVWPAMVIWCVALMWWITRHLGWRWTIAAGAFTPLMLALLVQLHYTVSFGIPFMSSWSGQNVAKALQTSGQLTVSPEPETVLTDNVCQGEIFRAWQSGDLNIWDPGGALRQRGCRDLPPFERRGIAAWDEPLKPGSTEMNFNEGRALVASAQWTGLMNTIVRAEPWQLVRMATTSESGFVNSGLGLYLRASDDYPFLDQARLHLPTAMVAAPFAALFAPMLWILVIIGWATAIILRSSGLRKIAAFWFASGLLVYHASVSNLLEYSENMRYRAEVDPVLLFAGVVVLLTLMSTRKPS